MGGSRLTPTDRAKDPGEPSTGRSGNTPEKAGLEAVHIPEPPTVQLSTVIGTLAKISVPTIQSQLESVVQSSCLLCKAVGRADTAKANKVTTGKA